MPETRVHRLLVAYNGESFQGWQRQGHLPTVQLALERVASKIWGKHVDVQGSGRTDTGVHALGQIASFEASPRIPDPHRLRMAFNNFLPPAVRVMDNDLGPAEFHARFSAIGKEYQYRIINREIIGPFDHGRAWHVPPPLNLDAMRESLACLLGPHDFSSFASNPGYKRTTMVRNMHDARLWERDGEIRVNFRADGFLYRMVRNLMGALVKVGLGKISPADFHVILEARNRRSASNTAPPGGLYLMRVFYPEGLMPSFNGSSTNPSTSDSPPWP